MLVVIDPLVNYLGKSINIWNDQDVRRAMVVLSQLANETGAAIVVVRHLNKKEDVRNKMYRGGGSIGIMAAVRSALLIAPDPHNPDLRVLSTNKSSLSAAPTPLVFEVASVEYEGTEEGMPQIVWLGEQSHAAGRPASSSIHQESSKLEDAKKFLRELLELGPQESTQLLKDARKSKISTTCAANIPTA